MRDIFTKTMIAVLFASVFLLTSGFCVDTFSFAKEAKASAANGDGGHSCGDTEPADSSPTGRDHGNSLLPCCVDDGHTGVFTESNQVGFYKVNFLISKIFNSFSEPELEISKQHSLDIYYEGFTRVNAVILRI